MSITKQCTKCGEDKALDSYDADKRGRHGKRSQCKTCMRKYREENKEKIFQRMQNYYQENRERKAEKNRKYYQENREQLAKNSRIYRQENKERVAERKRNYAQENKERIVSYQRNYRKENPETYRRAQRKRRAFKRNLPHQPLTPQQYEILHRQKYEIFGGNASGN